MVKLMAEKSGLPTIAAIRGVSRSLVKAVTTVAKAAPMTTPTAISTTLPRRMNCLKPLSMGILRSLESAINVSGGAGLVKKCRTGPIGSSKLERAKLQSDSLRAFLFDYDVYLTLWSFDREGENHLQFRRSPPSLSFPRNQHC